MQEKSNQLKQGVTALRDHGEKGYKATPIHAADVEKHGWNPGTFGRGAVGGKTIQINVDHPLFNNAKALSWDVGHESAHNAGVGRTVDTYIWDKENYKNLSPEQRLDNADTVVDFTNH